MITINIEDLVIFTFLLIIFLSFLKYCLWYMDINNRGLQKIIGGLSVFVIAIIANEYWIYFTSLFIGGLIIASEDFMKFLAAVIKSNNDKISETIDSLNRSKATREEVQKKNVEETQNIEVVPQKEGDIKFSANEKINARLKILKKVEGLVNSYLKNKYKDSYDIQIKLKNKDNEIIVDGIIIENSVIKKIVEIRYVSSGKYDNLKYIIHRFEKKLKNTGLSVPLLFVIASDTMTEQDALEVKNQCLGSNIDFLFFKLLSNSTLEEITV